MADSEDSAGVTMNLGLGETSGNIEVRRIERASHMPDVAAEGGDERPLLSQLPFAVN